MLPGIPKLRARSIVHEPVKSGFAFTTASTTTAAASVKINISDIRFMLFYLWELANYLNSAPKARVVIAWANGPGKVGWATGSAEGAKWPHAIPPLRIPRLQRFLSPSGILSWAVGPGYYISRLWR